MICRDACLRCLRCLCLHIQNCRDLKDNDALLALVQSCIGTKFSSRWGDRVIEMAVQATLRVVQERGSSTGGGSTGEGTVKGGRQG